jgi:hypothetical protein
MLSKKEILALSPGEEVVEVSGGKVMMRGLSAEEYGDYERGLLEQGPDGMFKPKPIVAAWRARLVALCLTDEDGATFTHEEVAGLDAAVVAKLYEVARKLCGVSEKDVEELTAVFESAQLDGNSSG